MAAFKLRRIELFHLNSAPLMPCELLGPIACTLGGVCLQAALSSQEKLIHRLRPIGLDLPSGEHCILLGRESSTNEAWYYDASTTAIDVVSVWNGTVASERIIEAAVESIRDRP
jgi:hypothetical protein